MVPSTPEGIKETPHLFALCGVPEVYGLQEDPGKSLLVLHGELPRTWISAGSTLYAFAATPQHYVQLAEEIRSAVASEMLELSLSESESRFQIVHPLKDVHFAQVGRYEHYLPNCLILEAHPHEADSFFQNPHAFLSDRDFLEELASRVLDEFRSPEELPVLTRSETEESFPSVLELTGVRFSFSGRGERYREKCVVLETAPPLDEHGHSALGYVFGHAGCAFLTCRSDLEHLADRLCLEYPT